MNELRITRFPTLDYACNEAINTLCSNLFYCGEDLQSILFTSRYEQEGKSSIAMNTMRTLASFGKRVVLVDADLRRSSLVRRYRFQYAVEKPYGLAQYLAGLCPLETALYITDIPNACIIPAGREVLSAMQLVKPETAKGQTAASAPPARIASAYPCLMARKASPIVWLEVAQAVTTGRVGPWALQRIEMVPAAILPIIMGTIKGETRFPAP